GAFSRPALRTPDGKRGLPSPARAGPAPGLRGGPPAANPSRSIAIPLNPCFLGPDAAAPAQVPREAARDAGLSGDGRERVRWDTPAAPRGRAPERQKSQVTGAVYRFLTTRPPKGGRELPEGLC